MDVVYVVREGEKNDELRYSLRSLVNLPHDRVFIAGYRPSWCSPEVTRIPTVQDAGKFRNTWRNVAKAAATAEVSDEFILMNDDHFVMENRGPLRQYNRGPIREVVGRYRKGIELNRYQQALIDLIPTLQRLDVPDPMCFDAMHLPQAFEKAALVECLQIARTFHSSLDDVILWATYYGNLFRTDPGKTVRNMKVGDTSGWESLPFLSSGDRSFRYGEIGRFVRRRFPTPSPYELR